MQIDLNQSTNIANLQFNVYNLFISLTSFEEKLCNNDTNNRINPILTE